ncbi:hypothetical protein ABIB25_001256 [Nakamurella sp. UYEF19]|uniref:hypothetical protein n=1 Tax=Nakamurella sp. UYEF19 TaxID=1756392 RepID=UPI0033915488
MTTGEAAVVLGVTQREARRLAQTGDLLVAGTVGRALLLDSASVHRAAGTTARHGRPWNQQTAWAAINLLNGGKATWLGESERSRLKSRLIRRTTAEELNWLARRRAKTSTYRASTSYLTDVQRALVASGVADTGRTDVDFGLAPRRDHAEGYTDAAGVASVVDYYELVPDPTGNVTIHETSCVAGLRMGSSAALTAVDLAGSLDTRERSAGLRVLRELLRSIGAQA